MVNKVGLRNDNRMSNGVWGFIHAHRRSGVVQCEGRSEYMYIEGRRVKIIGEIWQYLYGQVGLFRLGLFRVLRETGDWEISQISWH